MMTPSRPQRTATSTRARTQANDKKRNGRKLVRNIWPVGFEWIHVLIRFFRVLVLFDLGDSAGEAGQPVTFSPRINQDHLSEQLPMGLSVTIGMVVAELVTASNSVIQSVFDDQQCLGVSP